LAQDTVQVKILVELCWAYRNSSIDTAIIYGQKALAQALKLNYQTILPKTYTYLGVLHRNRGDYTKALESYFLSVKVSETLKDYEQLGYGLQSIGDINNRQANYSEAIKFTQQGLKQFEEIKDNRGKAYCYYTLGNIYSNKKDYDRAIEFHEKALEIRRHLNEKGNIASSLGVMSGIYYKQKRKEESLQFAIQAKNIFKETNDLRGIASTTNQMAQIEFDNKEYDICIQQAKEALAVSQKSGNIEYIKDSYWLMFECSQAKNDIKNAYDYQKLYLLYEDSLLNQERSRQAIGLESKYNQEKHNLQVKTLENEEKNRLYIRYAMVIIGIIILALITLFVRIYLKRKKTTALLREQAEEIISKNEQLSISLSEINSKNENINKSIGYALRIQSAMLLSEKHLQQTIPKSFILFLPRDIVSGDFYWFAEKPTRNGKLIILAVADCTGHGVPGAFMSMIGDSLLNQIVHDKEVHQPHHILNQLDIGVRNALHQDETSQNDGMDISIVVLNYVEEKLNRLIFAGAMNPAYIVAHNTTDNIPVLHTLKADKKPIGGSRETYKRKKDVEQFTSFTKQTIHINQIQEEFVNTTTLNKNAHKDLQTKLSNEVVKVTTVENMQTPFTLYLCSDGFQDQFGGKNDRKFMTSKMRNLFVEISSLPIEEQKQRLEHEFYTWKGKKKQTDDVTIIGLDL
jgi:serine phosphatase RsbU (regulator of sigma subunit)